MPAFVCYLSFLQLVLLFVMKITLRKYIQRSVSVKFLHILPQAS